MVALNKHNKTGASYDHALRYTDQGSDTRSLGLGIRTPFTKSKSHASEGSLHFIIQLFAFMNISKFSDIWNQVLFRFISICRF